MDLLKVGLQMTFQFKRLVTAFMATVKGSDVQMISKVSHHVRLVFELLPTLVIWTFFSSLFQFLILILIESKYLLNGYENSRCHTIPVICS